MASFLRGKQAGIQNDLSAAITPGMFMPIEQQRFGINSMISCFAFEPIQSLLAVGTNESKFGPGKIYIFGHKRVHKILTPTRSCSFRQLHFVADRLISLDNKSEISVWDLVKSKRVAAFSASGGVIQLVTDPGLDWAFLGIGNGEISAYDLDCERPAPFRLPNFWREQNPRAKIANLVSMQLHPRDIGKLLIGYTAGAVIYSFKQNAPTKFFEYKLPPGAPGGNSDAIDSPRTPRLTHAVWHPSGTFILTAHDDGSLVFWDTKDGRIVMARSLYATKVNEPGPQPEHPSLMDPFTKISWCCKGSNPDDTGILIAGGQKKDDPEKGMTFLELGPTPIYATSSWEVLTQHFTAKKQYTLPTPPGAEVVDYCLVPRQSPYFTGAQDPIAIITLLSSGEVITMTFPSGYPISPTNQLHPSLTLVAPFVNKIAVSTMDRARWLGMEEKRQQGELLLKGGALGAYPRRKHERRNIIQVAHGDSTVRLWDLGHGDEIENPNQLQIDVARALNRWEDVQLTAMGLAENTGEYAVGTNRGEVVIYRWGGNKYFGRDDSNEAETAPPNPGGLSDISSRTEPSLKEGLQPFVLYEMMQGPITALCVSDIGFVAVGSEAGFFSVIDLRGPSIIFSASLAEFKQEKKSFLKSHSSSASAKEWPVVIQFGVMTIEEDKFSSILCCVGTNTGRVLSFKLLPSGQSYKVNFAGSVSLNGKVIAICPIVADIGRPASANGETVAGLRNGQKTNGTLVVVTQSEIRIFKPATHRGASKSFEDVLCDAATVADFQGEGCAVVGLFGDRTARAFSLPGLKELGRTPQPMLDGSRTTAAVVARTGDIIAWTGPSEFTVIPAWGTARVVEENTPDTLINPELKTPPRPTISNLQWISGTQYVSPTDLDLLVGGPDRPPSKRMQALAAEEQRLARSDGTSGSGANPRTGTSQEGWGEYLTRQMNERTERLNIMSDQMDNLQDKTSNWADDVSKYVSKQKRSMLLGGITKGLF